MEPCLVKPFKVKEIPRYTMSDKYVGLLLITYNDAENLKNMLPSLNESMDYPTVLHIMDMGSTDDSKYIIGDWILYQTGFSSVTFECWNSLESLTKVMNAGFKYLMSRQECDYIGWIHPDMLFTKGWLSKLVTTLQKYPEIAKVCSFNTRDGEPISSDFIEGQEQAYIVNRGVLLRTGLFDESFIGIGGYEDWDLNNRIKQEGYRVVINPNSKVFHSAMATRSRRDTSAEQIHNAGVYQRKWNSYREDAI